MPLTRQQKQKIIEELKENIARQKAMVFVDFKGLSAKDMAALKKSLVAAAGILRVCKKTLLDIALKEKKVKMDAYMLPGQVAVAFGFGQDTAALKAVYEFAKQNENLKILAGFIGGELRDKNYLVVLAELPSKGELLARLVGSIKAPVSNLAHLLQANIKGLLYVLAKAKT